MRILELERLGFILGFELIPGPVLVSRESYRLDLLEIRELEQQLCNFLSKRYQRPIVFLGGIEVVRQGIGVLFCMVIGSLSN